MANAHALAAIHTREPAEASAESFIVHVAAVDCSTSAFVAAIEREVRS